MYFELSTKPKSTMKNILSSLLLILVCVSLSTAQQTQLELLQQLSGKWSLDTEKLPEGMDMPPVVLECNPVTPQNGMYCVVKAMMNGTEVLVQSELLAYDQNTNKIHLMLFDGPNVTKGDGSFSGNKLTYTDYDASGNVILDGVITFESDKIVQEITPANQAGSIMFYFNKED